MNLLKRRMIPSVFFAVLLCLPLTLAGCQSSRYEEVTVEDTTAPSGISTFSLEVAGSEEVAETAEASEASEPETPSDPYQEVDETVIVTADVLNVRASDQENARIYAQLPAGTTLQRIGYTEEWSRILYHGEPAYAASELIEVYVEPSEEETAEAAPEGEPEVVEAAVPAEAENPVVVSNGYVIALDAGSQAKSNSEKEPIGPGSDTMSPKMPKGSTGTSTGVKECELTLTIAQKLEKALKAAGYEVVMTRETNDVNLSHAERAAVAEKADADVLIRLHADSMDNSSVYGALATCMTSDNPYHPELHDKSYRLSKYLIDALCAETGAKNRGVKEVDNNSEVNWSTVPVSVLNVGYLSNPDEDQFLQNEEYQDKIVAGIMNAVNTYFNGI